MLKSLTLFLLKLFRWSALLVLLWVLLGSFLPIPYTGLMLERQLDAWWQGQSYQRQHQWVPYEKISRHAKQAVVAAEDQKFPEHYGFDMAAIEKALVYNSKGSKVRGASTISQQTAKNVFLWSGRSWLRKGLESGFTLLIELAWGKQRILEVYLNSVEFGPGIYGVEAASRHFFSKSAARLTRQEAALLAAVLPNPLRFKVNRPSPYIYKRQQWILKQMNQLASVEKSVAD